MAAAASGLEIDVEVIRALQADGKIGNSLAFAQKTGIDHQALVGVFGSLSTGEIVDKSAPLKESVYALTPQGEEYLRDGLPEFKVLELVEKSPTGLTRDDPQLKAYPLAEAGLKFGMKEKILSRDKAGVYTAKASAKDWKNPTLADMLLIREKTGSDAEKEAAAKRLGSRKLCTKKELAYFCATPGANFPTEPDCVEKRSWRAKKPADFDADMLQKMLETGKIVDMKPANLNAYGLRPAGGNLHPLMKLRQVYREIFLELGFQEMDTARWIDSSFWNFDTLFVPQQHPARDSQDTFFVSNPPKTVDHPADYLDLIHKVHTAGDFGSTGYRSAWSKDETERNVLRTHTTAISAYTLHQIGQEYKKTGVLRTGAYFSIDRVFRNEQTDKKHLCEFHQMEGFVLDYGLSLSNMMSLLKAFFERVGLGNLKFKAAYNPYTEPSMEVHTEDTKTGKVMEVGNSGVFRPEMLRPMGIPEGATCIAWGLGLERVAMRHYKLDSIHDLFGHEVSLPFVQNAATPRV
ncbi:Phenylalanine--tRNA ligase alpha subunit [Diplonema papillatum]|nr:Phenylalanine--tRNA ligase alpha subunit [Diplonema papillatum]